MLAEGSLGHLIYTTVASVSPHSAASWETEKKDVISLFLNPEAAAAAKPLQSCLTLSDPIDGSPPGSPVPGILQARILEWVVISFSDA